MGKRWLLRLGSWSLRPWLSEQCLGGITEAQRNVLHREVRARYLEAAEQVPWPARRRLRLHLVFAALPAVAVYQALTARGWQRDRAVQVIGCVLEERFAGRRKLYERLARRRLVRAAFLPLVRLATRLVYPAPGWQAAWREESSNAVAFDMTRCYLVDTFARLGVPEIGPAYCAVDDQLYTDLCPQLRWLRTQTLAQGAPTCDFRFERRETVPSRRETARHRTLGRPSAPGRD